MPPLAKGLNELFAVAGAATATSAARASAPHLLILVLMAGILGAIYTLYLFPLDFLAGTSAFWQVPPIADLATEIAGVRYYLGDAWRFPLFRTLKIAAPEGISIVFLDTLPLFAIVAKLLKGYLSQGWTYFGIWIGLCYLLQAVSAVVLLAALGVRSHAAALAGAVMALSAPAFLFRLFHVTLSAHFLVLLALALYFIAVRTAAFRLVWAWFVLLVWLSLWVQPYLFVMVAMIFCATAVQMAVTTPRCRVEAGVAVVIGLVGIVCLMWLSGFFWDRAAVRFWEVGTPQWFGKASMNVLSPLIPQWSELLPGVSAYFGDPQGPYQQVGVIDATGGQYEGFNYLGAGVLLLAAVAFCLDRKNFLLHMRKYWGLLAALVVLTALAITHRVYVGEWGIVLFDRVPLVLEEVRSSGRLFWPVGYAVMAYAITVVARQRRRWLAAGLLLAAAGVQVADAAWIRLWIHQYTTRDHTERFMIPATPWVGLVADHRAVSIFPTYGCAAESKAWNLIAEIVFHASRSLTPVNTAAIDRVNDVDCAAEARSVRQMAVDERNLLVLLSPRDISEFAVGHPEYRQICRAFDKGWACSGHWQRIEEQGWSAPFRRL